MHVLDEKILDLKSKMNDKKRIKEKLKKMFNQKMELNRRQKELYDALKKEELDVEKLEGMSFANFFHSIKGDKENKLQKEKEEALTAKLKYDSVCREIQGINNDMERVREKLDALNDIEEAYENLIKEKTEILVSSRADVSEVLVRLHDEEVKVISREKEIKEAIEAGEVLLQSLYRVKEYLQSAGAWGTWDILGGGFISTMAKHSKIDSARNEISIAQGKLRNFHRELKDVGNTINIDIEIGSFLTFADYFFDGLFADLTVQSRINDSKQRVENTIDDVNSTVNILRRELKLNESNRENMETRKNEIIENNSLD